MTGVTTDHGDRIIPITTRALHRLIKTERAETGRWPAPHPASRDHICITNSLVADISVRCWEATNEAGVRLSDHPTVAIDVRSAIDSRRVISQ